MTVLKIENLIKDYGTLRAVNQVSFDIQSGEIFGLLGPNGAGKTSIISTIVTVEKPTSGRISLLGKSMTSRNEKELKARVGFVPQEIVNTGYFKVMEIMKFQSGLYGVRNNGEKIQSLLQRLDLWEHRFKTVRALSGGMKRRLMLAKALVHSPELLLLDEPTAGVDVELRHSIWRQVLELKNSGVAILLTTHYLEEAERLCDRIGIINKGEIQKTGKTSALIKELTSRHLSVYLKHANPDYTHPKLISNKAKVLTFLLPHFEDVGHFLSGLHISFDKIKDIRIREGSLEEVFQYVLKNNKKKPYSFTKTTGDE